MAKKRLALQLSKSDKIFDGIVFVVLTAAFVIIAYPLYFILISSVSDPVAVAAGQVVFLPECFTLDGYRRVFETPAVMRGFVNSIFYTVMGVAVNIVVTLPTAYALSRNDFFGRKVITMFYIFTMFVSGGLIPTFVVVRTLGMLDTVWALVLPGALGVFNLMVARTFFKMNIPQEMLDAAQIDGCSYTRFFLKIVLPLSGALIAILILWTGVAHWNSYFSALVYITTRERMPLQLELRFILLQGTEFMDAQGLSVEAMEQRRRMEALRELMRYSLIVIANIPILMLYPFVQRYFIKGVQIGSLKG